MKNKKPIIALGALAIVGLIAGTIAYFTSEATFDNVFTTAVYKTESTEVFQSPENWVPGQKVDKTLVTENKGNIKVAVRVKAEESWKDASDAVIADAVIAAAERDIAENLGIDLDQYDANPANYPQTKLALIGLDNTSDWTYSNGYYYYNTAVAAGETTSSFIKDVTLNAAAEVDNSCTTEDTNNNTTHTTTCTTTIAGLGKATYTLTLTVETIQFDQYSNVWTGAPTITE